MAQRSRKLRKFAQRSRKLRTLRRERYRQRGGDELSTEQNNQVLNFYALYSTKRPIQSVKLVGDDIINFMKNGGYPGLTLKKKEDGTIGIYSEDGVDIIAADSKNNKKRDCLIERTATEKGLEDIFKTGLGRPVFITQNGEEISFLNARNIMEKKGTPFITQKGAPNTQSCKDLF